MTFNATDIKFEEPIQRQILPFGRHYYTQALKCKGNDLILASDWFLSHGIITDQLDGKPEIKVKNCLGVVNILHEIEQVAIEQMKLPSEYNYSGSFESVFKHFPSASNLYFKLSHDCVFFDKDKSVIRPVDMSHGNYRVIFKINGIYMGPHGATEKLGSLQVRIIQMQYEPFVPPCYFDLMAPIVKPQSSLPAEVNFPEIDQIAQPKQTASKKKGGRPKLPRLSSVFDLRPHQIKESNPAEVLTDVDMDSTQ